MSRRRIAVLVSAAVLLAAFLARQPFGEIGRRLAFLNRYASQELPVRRAGGSSAEFDRAYFVLLENARRRLPRSAPGLGILPERPIPERGLYLTIYHLAPVAVRVAPDRIPGHWPVLVFGSARPEGRRVLAELPGGALLEPAR